MSGGSFNYLCHKNEQELLSGIMDSELASMVEELAELCPEAAKATESLLAEMRLARIRVAAKIDMLEEIWHAVEWYRSCDYSEDTVKEVIEKWRKEHP